MEFGEIGLEEARGAILAHGIRRDSVNFKKGRVLSEADIETLRANAVERVVAARLGPDDVHEDAAAKALGTALTAHGLRAKAPFTGRVNLFCEAPGALVFDTDALTRLNRVHESITVAALPCWSHVQPRQMVATVKIIPFAAPKPALDEALAHASQARFAVRAFEPHTVALIQTELPGTRASVLDKTTQVLRKRLAHLQAKLVHEERVAHQTQPIADAVARTAGKADWVLIAGASAIVDRRDVVPAGIVAAGGAIEHFGMPVDPGNLLLLAKHDGRPVLGLPGCARSPARNGVDLVLERLAVGVSVSSDAVMAMGPGGLLKEFAGRPSPRLRSPEPSAAVPRVAGVVLAAGQSRRMGSVNKLLTEVDGTPMVVAAVREAAAAGLEPVVVVTGHEAQAVRAALGDMPVTWVHNDDYADGLSTSLRSGLGALPDDISAAIVCLADMPAVRASVLDKLVAAYDPVEGRSICVPTWQGKRGNPVLWDRGFFADMMSVNGDTGARHLLGEHDEVVCEVAMPDDAVLRDIDSPADLDTFIARSRQPGDG